MYITCKKTVWERVTFPDGIDESSVKKMLMDTCSKKAWYYYFTELVIHNGFSEFSLNVQNIDITEEYVSVDDNGGMSTVEFYNDFDALVWSNGKCYDFKPSLDNIEEHTVKDALYYTEKHNSIKSKSINVYKIIDNVPKSLISFELDIDATVENEIRAWLDINGINHEDYDITML